MIEMKVRYLIKRRGSYYWYPSHHMKHYPELGLKSIPLGKLPGPATQRAIEENANLERIVLGLERQGKAERGSIGWLIGEYKKDEAFLQLRPSTQASYMHTLNFLYGRFWDIQAKDFERAHAKAFYQRHRHKPRQAQEYAKLMRILFGLAYDMGLVTSNPFSALRVKRNPPRQEIWAPEQIAAFQARARAMGWPSMALAMQLLVDTGQRPGDVVDLAWTNYDGVRIALLQSKTGERVSIPVTRALKAMLDTTDKRGVVILISEKSERKYKRQYFSTLFSEIRDAAGIPSHLQPRDLRRTAAVRLAEAECTPKEIAAITGHKIDRSSEILETYVPTTDKMADNAIEKLENLKHRSRSLEK